MQIEGHHKTKLKKKNAIFFSRIYPVGQPAFSALWWTLKIIIMIVIPDAKGSMLNINNYIIISQITRIRYLKSVRDQD